MKVVILYLCLSLVSGYGAPRSTIVHYSNSNHDHPILIWEILEKFVGRTFYITQSQTLSLPIGAQIGCDEIEGYACSWPGYVNYAHDHVDFHFDLSNPFYSFVDSFYISLGAKEEKIYLRVVGATPRAKLLNIGCHNSFDSKLPFGTKIYHDKDMQYLVDGRHLECIHRVYFVKYCPHHAGGYCFIDRLKVYNLKQVKSKKDYDKLNQYKRIEL
nr:MAG: nonstructural protein 7b [Canine coronavirus]